MNKRLGLHRSSRRVASGMSLVELMVAITIGALIVATMSLLFANNSRSRSETERSSQNIENGRYALEVLRGELHNAGYFGAFDSSRVALPAAKPDACATALADLRLSLGLHIQGYNDITAATLGCLTDVKAGTDAFLVRRVSGTSCDLAGGACGSLAGKPTFQASLCGKATETASADVSDHFRLDSDLANLDRHKRDCTTAPPGTLAEARRYVARVYYVAGNDRAGDGIPTLKYAELGTGGFSPTSLVQGVENLQVEYGIDADGNGDAETYTADPDVGCAPADCVARWSSVVAVKLFVLSRSVDQSPGHNDTNTYVLGRKADGTANSYTSLAAAYKRKVFQEVVRLQNPAGRRGTN
ncbi:MAG TPA: PilW family protein [Ramlibacter sp.]